MDSQVTSIFDAVEAKFLQTLLHAKAVIESKAGDQR